MKIRFECINYEHLFQSLQGKTISWRNEKGQINSNKRILLRTMKFQKMTPNFFTRLVGKYLYTAINVRCRDFEDNS